MKKLSTLYREAFSRPDSFGEGPGLEMILGMLDRCEVAGSEAGARGLLEELRPILREFCSPGVQRLAEEIAKKYVEKLKLDEQKDTEGEMSKPRMQDTDAVIWSLNESMEIEGFFGAVQKDQAAEVAFFAREGKIKVGTLGTKTFGAAYRGAARIMETASEQKAFLEKAAAWYDEALKGS